MGPIAKCQSQRPNQGPGPRGVTKGRGGWNHGPNQKRQTQQTFLSMEQEARETDIEFPSMVNSVRAARKFSNMLCFAMFVAFLAKKHKNKKKKKKEKKKKNGKKKKKKKKKKS